HFGHLHARETLGAKMELLLFGGQVVPACVGGCSRRRCSRRGRGDGNQLRWRDRFGESAPHGRSHLGEQLDGGTLHASPSVDQGRHALAYHEGIKENASAAGVIEELAEFGGDFGRRAGGSHRVAALHGGGQRGGGGERNL